MFTICQLIDVGWTNWLEKPLGTIGATGSVTIAHGRLGKAGVHRDRAARRVGDGPGHGETEGLADRLRGRGPGLDAGRDRSGPSTHTHTQF